MDVRDGTHDSPKYYSDGIPFVTSKCLKNNTIDFSLCKLICAEDAKKFNERSYVDDKDILFAMIGTIGNATIVNKDRDFSIKNVALFKNINRDFLSEKWIKYILDCLTNKMKEQTSSGLQPFVSLDFLRNYIIPVPPVNEQFKIINKLDNIFSKLHVIEKDIIKLNNLIDKVKHKILDYYFGEQSCYKSYYEKMGVLTDDVEILDYLRKPINSTERLARLKKASIHYPYYGSTGLAGYIDDYLLDGEYILLGEDAAPFLDKNASKAYLINGKSWVNNHAHILKSTTSNKYLMYYLNWFDYSNYVSGTTRLKLSQGNMKKIPFPILKKEIKDKIVSQIENTFYIIDKIKEQLK